MKVVLISQTRFETPGILNYLSASSYIDKHNIAATSNNGYLHIVREMAGSMLLPLEHLDFGFLVLDMDPRQILQWSVKYGHEVRITVSKSWNEFVVTGNLRTWKRLILEKETSDIIMNEVYWILISNLGLRSIFDGYVVKDKEAGFDLVKV